MRHHRDNLLEFQHYLLSFERLLRQRGCSPTRPMSLGTAATAIVAHADISFDMYVYVLCVRALAYLCVHFECCSNQTETKVFAGKWKKLRFCDRSHWQPPESSWIQSFAFFHGKYTSILGVPVVLFALFLNSKNTFRFGILRLRIANFSFTQLRKTSKCILIRWKYTKTDERTSAGLGCQFILYVLGGRNANRTGGKKKKYEREKSFGTKQMKCHLSMPA